MTDALWREPLKRMRGFFARMATLIHRRPPEPAIEIQLDGLACGATTPPAPVPVGPKATAPKLDKTTMADLLESLEGSFDALRTPALSSSWLDKDSIKGLRKLGVHVTPWFTKAAACPAPSTVATLMMLGFGRGESNDDSLSPAFAFAVKHTKLPWYVQRRPGVPFQFGFAYPSPSGKKRSLWWLYAWLVVSESGEEVHFCEELHTTRVAIPGARKTYSRKQWGSSALLLDGRGKEIRSETMIFCFKNMAHWWSKRDSRWNVVVKSGKDRVTFAIEKEDTKRFFVDRDKAIKARDGTAKKIVHYVNAHNRTREGKTTTVAAHIRGLRKFSWRGYDVLVTCPGITGGTSSDFVSPATAADVDPFMKGVPLSAVGRLLADAEETDVRSAAALASLRKRHGISGQSRP